MTHVKINGSSAVLPVAADVLADPKKLAAAFRAEADLIDPPIVPPPPPPPPPPAWSESLVGTVILPGGGSIVDKFGNKWAIKYRGNGGPSTDNGLFRNDVYVTGAFVTKVTYEASMTFLEETTAYGTWRKLANEAGAIVKYENVTQPAPPPPPSVPPAPPSTSNQYRPPGFTVVFRDEFDGFRSDLWNYITPALYNNDRRMGGQPMVSFANSVMTVSAKNMGTHYLTGGLTSKGKWNFRGAGRKYFAARIKTLGINGAGGWLGGHTGFWSYATDNGGGREMDFLEVLTRNQYGNWANMYLSPMSTLHQERAGASAAIGNRLVVPFDPAGSFNVYDCLWEPDRMHCRVNGMTILDIREAGVGTRFGFGTQAFDVLLQTFIGEPDITQDAWLGIPVDSRAGSAVAQFDWFEYCSAP